MFKMLFVSGTSVCFELDNDLIYYNDAQYQVIFNGEILPKQFDTNVFSLFNLIPDTKYTIQTTLDNFKYEFTTAKENCCINIMDFGAIGDGKTDNTRAIQSAINVCMKNGRVLIPKGVFYTGPIVLKSHITLEVSTGAKLLASSNELDYPLLPGEIECQSTGKKLQFATWEGHPRQCYQSFISAHHAEDIKIIGDGVIDGNGPNGIWYINHKAMVIGRPRLFFVNDCDNVTVHGITGNNSASWNFHPFFSHNVSFYDIKVNADKNSPNTDGCNPESCDNVNIIGSVFSVGDDCVAIKSGKVYMGKKYKVPSKNITIRNCLMQYGHGAIVLGSELAGGITDLSISRCLFSHTDRGLRIKTRRGRGKDAIVDNVTFSHIKMDNVLTPLVINMFYFCDPDGKKKYVWSKEKFPVDEMTPYIGKCHFKDIVCEDCEYAAGFFYGLPEQPIKEITLENISFSVKKDAKPGIPAMMSYAKKCCKEGLYFNNVENVILKNVTFSGVVGKEVQTINVNNIDII